MMAGGGSLGRESARSAVRLSRLAMAFLAWRARGATPMVGGGCLVRESAWHAAHLSQQAAAGLTRESVENGYGLGREST